MTVQARKAWTWAAVGLALWFLWWATGSWTARSGAAAGSAAPHVTLRHTLWDANQRPLYQQCASAFEAAHPGVRVRVEQLGWDDYWTSLATGFVAETAPDVFTHHLTRFSEFVENGVMLDLSPLMARDGPHDDPYEPGLLDMWRAEGRPYGLPTDWDTIALVVNVDLLQAAGLQLADLRRMDWNPQDGGSLGRVIARLTQDESGRRGDETGFDPNRVRVYGWQTPASGGMMGQTEWSHFAVSTGWRFQSRPWDGDLAYGDPRFVATLDWLANLARRGLAPSSERIGRISADTMFLTGRTALMPSGAWMVGHFARHAKFRHAWVPLPIGPSGQRASMRNSLALSVWSGTRHAELAWQYVRFVGSRECQALIAPHGVVYPAIRGLAASAVAAQRARGVDAQVFLETARGLTFPPPIVRHAAEVNDLMATTLERVLSGRVTAAQALPEAQRRVQALTAGP